MPRPLPSQQVSLKSVAKNYFNRELLQYLITWYVICYWIHFSGVNASADSITTPVSEENSSTTSKWEIPSEKYLNYDMLSHLVKPYVTCYWIHFPEAHASDNQRTTSADEDVITEHSHSSTHQDIERVTSEGRETNGTRTTRLFIGKCIDIFRQPFKPLMPKQHDRHFAGHPKMHFMQWKYHFL